MKYGSANFSRCGTFRYVLTRSITDELKSPSVTFVMLNPAKADELNNDQTIGKCIGFAQRWGMNSLRVINLYAFRTSYQNELYAAEDPVGPQNRKWLRSILNQSDKVVCAWGKGVDKNRVAHFKKLADKYEVQLFCLGHNLDGSPKHPARIAYDVDLIPFEIRTS